MTTLQKNESNVPVHSKIIGVQFGIMSPEEIVKQSVVEVTSHETYERDEPTIKGLFDPRMGVLDIGKVCRTCGLKNKDCPGHFGHITLAKPVFYQQFLTYVLKILKFVCIRCSKILINKESAIVKTLMKKPTKIRWIEMHKLCSKIKRCGQEHDCGCGCLQPSKYFKATDKIFNIYAEWKAGTISGESAKKQLLTAETIHTMFSRISDEDCLIMGLNPQWCRPEWLICTVLPISPPAVRPSVRESTGTQRMDDDLTHKLCDIVKANKNVAARIEDGSSSEIVEGWVKLLQWHVATLIDNDIPGVPQAVHRSNRPIKSILQRLKGKEGRIRSNLMGKRVDFSARSVITPDPNIGIDELGVPIKIATNLTFPEKVTRYNLNYCKELVLNGPEKHPGVNSIIKRNTKNKIHLNSYINISLEDESDHLMVGDTINRHLIDGDVVLFNRQPSLHRMSMMGHRVRVMKGSTFRLNVSATTPYNADFDGDEMNMHVPQSYSSRFELHNLAFVPKQIISPRSNKPIISIVQDTLLGINKLTKYANIDVRNHNGEYRSNLGKLVNKDDTRIANCFFTLDQVMNILSRVHLPNFTMKDLPTPARDKGFPRKMWSGSQIFSLIIPKDENNTLNIQMSNKLNEDFSELDDTIVKIVDSVLEQGTLDKDIFNSTSKGLIHTIYNKFGEDHCRIFIDNIQRIITQFLIIEGFSVGISDLIVNEEVQSEINVSIKEKLESVDKLIREVHLGILETPPGKTNREFLEGKINSLLNKANNDAGKIAGNNVDENNRIINMINSGSKGSKINVGQMMACLGQQNVDGKRIPYGFDNRTLPHFKKCDDSADARGFVQNSFISGLTPQEYFFHAMGGREGLIDTAVKTSDTGYIQRKLIKSMEDLKALYDYSVRTSNGNVIQFVYGDDAMDAIKIEKIPLDIIFLNRKEIVKKYSIKGGEEKLTKLFEYKQFIYDEIFKRKDIENSVFSPVHFPRIINDIKLKNKGKAPSSKSLFTMIEQTKEKCFVSQVFPHIVMFNILLDVYLHPANLSGINKKGCLEIHQKVIEDFKDGLINPGEMVGPIAAQSIGEPATQMTLNTFHFAGVSSKSNVTRGIPRLKELIHVSKNLKNPSTTIYLKEKYATNQNKSKAVLNKLEYTKLKDIVENTAILYDPSGTTNMENSTIEEDNELLGIYREFMDLEENEDETCSPEKIIPWIIRIKFDNQSIMDKGLLMEDISIAINNWSDDVIKCIYSDDNSKNLVARLHVQLSAEPAAGLQDQSDIISKFKKIEYDLLNNVIIKGVSDITNIVMSNMNSDYVYQDEDYICKNSGKVKCNKEGEDEQQDAVMENWVLETDGVNLTEILANDYVDFQKTFSNHIIEMQDTLGIEAARNSLLNEIRAVVDDAGEYVNLRHIQLLVDLMTSRGLITPINRQGINRGDNGPLAKMSFEDTTEQIMKAGIFGDLDGLKGVSANIMMGQVVPCGTGNFSIMINEDELVKNIIESNEEQETDNEEVNLENYLDGNEDDEDDYCNDDNLDFSFNVE